MHVSTALLTELKFLAQILLYIEQFIHTIWLDKPKLSNTKHQLYK